MVPWDSLGFPWDSLKVSLGFPGEFKTLIENGLWVKRCPNGF
jgi:hypothetical protein